MRRCSSSTFSLPLHGQGHLHVQGLQQESAEEGTLRHGVATFESFRYLRFTAVPQTPLDSQWSFLRQVLTPKIPLGGPNRITQHVNLRRNLRRNWTRPEKPQGFNAPLLPNHALQNGDLTWMPKQAQRASLSLQLSDRVGSPCKAVQGAAEWRVTLMLRVKEAQLLDLPFRACA